MDLEEVELQELCRIWQEEFGEAISIRDARQRASELLELYFLLAQPLPAEKGATEEGRNTN